MSNLKIVINPDGRHVQEELRIDPPYEFVASFVASEMGHDLRFVEEWIAQVKRALAGEPFDVGPGNAWGVAASEETATLTNEYIEPPRNVRSLPTSMLLEVLERWHAFLEKSPKGRRSELAPEQDT
ncbi:MAG: hypothetical protein JWP97_4358 [Labilithrix sp.]|nr:hypothetical protein [Labilithrix sp.]